MSQTPESLNDSIQNMHAIFESNQITKNSS